LPERCCLSQLLRRPLLARGARHRDVDDSFGVHVDDEEREQGTEPDVVDLEEVASPDGVVSKERQPPLTAMRPRRTRRAHVLLDRALRDADIEFQKLATDSFRSPQDVRGRHLTDERDDVAAETRIV
jgi:hypothetical protein